MKLFWQMVRGSLRDLAPVVLVIVATVALDAAGYDLARLQAHRETLSEAYQRQPVLGLGLFALAFVVATASNLPIASLAGVGAGAVFGFWPGLAVVSLASTLGATLAFLIARLLLRDLVRRRWGERLATLDRGIERDGWTYLFALRLAPVVPFWLVNLGLAPTGLRTWTFVWVSWIGMLPGSALYVFAGTQLATLRTPGDLLSPGLIAALILLGLVPFVARRVTRLWQKTRRPRGSHPIVTHGAAGER